MNTITIEIQCDNAAFEGDQLPHEVAAILKQLANKVAGWSRVDLEEPGNQRLRDSNGNSVGLIEWDIEPGDDVDLDNGWALFDYDSSGLLQIQRIDELDLFESDAEAIAYVVKRAEEGSERHINAIKQHERDAAAIDNLNNPNSEET